MCSDQCGSSCVSGRSVAAQMMKQASSGPMHVSADDKKPGVLTLKNLNSKAPTAFCVQLYEANGFEIRPVCGVLTPKQPIDLEMKGGKPEAQSFHIACVQWPQSANPAFSKALWNKQERGGETQVLSFGDPPNFAGILEIGTKGAGVENGEPASSKGRNTGPKIIMPSVQNVSYKPPEGKSQTVTFRVKNLGKHPTAYKIMTNRPAFYKTSPAKGCIDAGDDIKVECELLPAFSKKHFDAGDNARHQIHVLAIKWPKKAAEYNPREWDRLEKARKDEKQRFIITIDHKGESAEVVKTAEELTFGPAHLQISPKKLTVSVPSTTAKTMTLENVKGGPVAFKIMTNRSKLYVINPTKGVVKDKCKETIKVDMSVAASFKDMTLEECAHHQILILAVPWTKGPTFNNDEFAKLQKIKKELQSACIAVALEKGSEHTYVKVKPDGLSFAALGDKASSCKITVDNTQDRVMAFKVDVPEADLLKHFSIEPATGVIKAKKTCEVKVTVNAKAKDSHMPPPGDFNFKLTAIPWPMDEFNEGLWTEFEEHKRDQNQTLRLPVDFDAGAEPDQPAESPTAANAVMEAFKKLQQMQQSMMMMQGMQSDMADMGMQSDMAGMGTQQDGQDFQQAMMQPSMIHQQGAMMQPGMQQGMQQQGMQHGMQQPGMQHGMQQPEMQPGMQYGMQQPEMQPGMQYGMQQPGMQPGMQQGMQPGMQQGMPPGMNMNTAFDPNQQWNQGGWNQGM